MNAEILCVGTEILLGDIVNTNAAYIARELAGIGIGCYYQTVVGDNPQRLEQALGQALSRADIVVMTGGLGPTYDDLTKDTVAKHFGLEMEFHAPSWENVLGIYKRMNRPMTDNNKQQAMMPKGAIVFHNDRGTANGLAVEQSGKIVIMMPGPPREMTAMFDNSVKPYLQELSENILVSHNIHMFGIGESAMEAQIRDYIQSSSNPTIAPYAKEGEVLLRVTASAKNVEEAEKLMEPVIADLCNMFSEYVYGVDVGTLQNALVQKLMEAGKTIATAESCTAGLVSKRITEVSGASKVFGCGLTTYSNEMKRKLLKVNPETLEAHGAVSEETAIEMAKGVRALSGADVGLSVTGIAGPDGGSAEKPVGLVYVAASTQQGEKCLRLQLGRGYGGEREFVRYAASSNALHLALSVL